jgi:hypothetical protein
MPRRLFRKAVQQGRSELRGSTYSLPYVEPLSDERTPLADFVNSLIGDREAFRAHRPPMRSDSGLTRGGAGEVRCPSCSQNAHIQKVLVRCAQSRATLTTPLSRCLEPRRGWSLMISCARATRGLRRPSLDARSAVRDLSAPIPRETTSKLGESICNLARRPHVDQHGCPSKKRKANKPGQCMVIRLGPASAKAARQRLREVLHGDD